MKCILGNPARATSVLGNDVYSDLFACDLFGTCFCCSEMLRNIMGGMPHFVFDCNQLILKYQSLEQLFNIRGHPSRQRMLLEIHRPQGSTAASSTTRNPMLPILSIGVSRSRKLDRHSMAALSQAPPRTTFKYAMPPFSQALPSDGAD